MTASVDDAPATTLRFDADGVDGSSTTSRLTAELLALELRLPRTAAALRRLWQRPAIGLVALALVFGTISGLLRQDGDEVRFRAAGAAMLGAHPFDVLSDSWLQIGPLYLFFVGCIERACLAVGLPPTVVSVVAAQVHAVVVALLAVVVAGRAARAARVGVRQVQWVVGTALVAGGFLLNSLEADHPEELVLGLLVAYAALLVAGGRPKHGVWLLVLATGVKQWVPTTAGLLFHGRRPGTVAVRLATYAAGVLVVYAPFAVFGHMATFTHQWPFPSHYWLERLPLVGGASDWEQRLVQGGLAGIAGAAVALRRRGSLLVSPLVAIATRLLIDPLRLTYYWAALAPVFFLWLWTSTPRTVLARRLRLPLTVGLGLIALCPIVPRGLWWHVETLAAVALPAYALLAERAGRAPERLQQEVAASRVSPDVVVPG
jgi:hypothetical protein